MMESKLALLAALPSPKVTTPSISAFRFANSINMERSSKSENQLNRYISSYHSQELVVCVVSTHQVACISLFAVQH